MIIPFLPPKLVIKFISEWVFSLMFILNFQVELLYSDDSLGVHINFVIKRLEILQVGGRSSNQSYGHKLFHFCHLIEQIVIPVIPHKYALSKRFFKLWYFSFKFLKYWDILILFVGIVILNSMCVENGISALIAIFCITTFHKYVIVNVRSFRGGYSPFLKAGRRFGAKITFWL